jgi:hypothetical protein
MMSMFQTAFTMKQQQQNTKCSTGIAILDDLLEGGFEPGLSYLLYGSPHCTKMLQQSVASALEQTSSEQGVAVIDANNGIRPDTIISYLRATSQQTSPTRYLTRLHVARAFTTDQLLSLLDDAANAIQEQRAPILFVNGLMHLVQEEEGKATSRSPRASPDPRVFRRAQLAAYLKQLAFTQQIAVVVSADAPKRPSQPPLRLGQSARHRFHVLIHHSCQDNVETYTLEKHPSRPWLQRSTVTPRVRRYPGTQQTLLFDIVNPFD